MSRVGLTLIVFLSVAGLLLAFEHRSHLFGSGWLLFGLLGLCVLMHVFMHGGRGHGDAPRLRDSGGGDGGGGQDR